MIFLLATNANQVVDGGLSSRCRVANSFRREFGRLISASPVVLAAADLAVTVRATLHYEWKRT